MSTFIMHFYLISCGSIEIIGGCVKLCKIVAGGMFALGAQTLKNDLSDNYTSIGIELTHTCHESYDRTPTKLGPEIFNFDKENEAIGVEAKEYILRPEVKFKKVQASFFYLVIILN